MKPTFKIKALALAIASLAAAQPCQVMANPTQGKVVAGNARIQQESASKIGISQSTDKAIIDWKSYSIDAGEAVQYYQPSRDAVTLNRVTGHDPSKILGSITANGQVFLVNPNGIYFGKSAQIDVGGLTATTHDIRNEAFMAGDYRFDIPGKPGAAVINEGAIRIADTGISALVAPSVANHGVIAARLGKVALASANGFTLDLQGDELLSFMTSDEVAQTAYDLDGNQLTSFTENAGKIEADGGYVLLSARAAENVVNNVINQSGIIEATSVGLQNGEIILSGGDTGIVRNTGTLDASGQDLGETGGSVIITGEKVGLFGESLVNVSGSYGGGKALIGGDYLGGRASNETMEKLRIQREEQSIPTAQFVNMSHTASIEANAANSGSAGKIVLWSDDATKAYGKVEANSKYGHGGFIEISGQKNLDIGDAKFSATGSLGSGTLLFDPGNIVIESKNNNTDIIHYKSIEDFTATKGHNTTTYISKSAIEGALNRGVNVVIRTSNEHEATTGSIDLNTSIQKSTGNDATISLFAADYININYGADISSSSGKLNIYLDSDYDRASYGRVFISSGSTLNTNGGAIILSGSEIVNNGQIITKGKNNNPYYIHGYTTLDIDSLSRSIDQKENEQPKSEPSQAKKTAKEWAGEFITSEAWSIATATAYQVAGWSLDLFQNSLSRGKREMIRNSMKEILENREFQETLIASMADNSKFDYAKGVATGAVGDIGTFLLSKLIDKGFESCQDFACDVIKEVIKGPGLSIIKNAALSKGNPAAFSYGLLADQTLWTAQKLAELPKKAKELGIAETDMRTAQLDLFEMTERLEAQAISSGQDVAQQRKIAFDAYFSTAKTIAEYEGINEFGALGVISEISKFQKFMKNPSENYCPLIEMSKLSPNEARVLKKYLEEFVPPKYLPEKIIGTAPEKTDGVPMSPPRTGAGSTFHTTLQPRTDLTKLNEIKSAKTIEELNIILNR